MDVFLFLQALEEVPLFELVDIYTDSTEYLSKEQILDKLARVETIPLLWHFLTETFWETNISIFFSLHKHHFALQFLTYNIFTEFFFFILKKISAQYVLLSEMETVVG